MFTYNVDWDEVPLPLVTALDEAEGIRTPVHPDILTNLQKWLVSDLFTKYEEFKENFAVRTKTAGMAVYRSIVSQVVTYKYQHCLKVVADGNVIDDGYNTFLNTFSHMMEHKGRSVPNINRSHPAATLATGTVGVQTEMYNPDLTEEEMCNQLKMQERLIEIFHTLREPQWPLQEIDKLMHQSFPLQRHEIVEGTRAINLSVAEEENENPDEPDRTGTHYGDELVYLIKLQK